MTLRATFGSVRGGNMRLRTPSTSLRSGPNGPTVNDMNSDSAKEDRDVPRLIEENRWNLERPTATLNKLTDRLERLLGYRLYEPRDRPEIVTQANLLKRHVPEGNGVIDEFQACIGRRRAYDYDGAAVLRRPVILSVYRVAAKKGGDQNEGYRAFHLVDQLRAKEFRTSAGRPIRRCLNLPPRHSPQRDLLHRRSENCPASAVDLTDASHRPGSRPLCRDRGSSAECAC
jgi:hypothetical protein